MGYQPTLATDMGQMQERITTTTKGSITSVQAIYVPADDLTDPAPATSFAHLDATTVLSRSIGRKGHLSGRGSAGFDLGMLDPMIVGEEHTKCRAKCSRPCSATGLQDIIAILGMDELSEEDKNRRRPRPARSSVSCRSRSSSRSLHRLAGKLVCARRHDQGLQGASVNGEYDHLPEPAFYMVGSIEEAVEKAKKLAAESGLICIRNRGAEFLAPRAFIPPDS